MQIAQRHYMPFAGRATVGARFFVVSQVFQEFVRAHLACGQLRGVEAENGKGQHLSEYIFGVREI